ncbi:MAG: hypothetical protein ABI142_08970, partial [Bryocella sp.]
YEFESRMNDMRNNGALGERFEDQRQDSGTPFTGRQQDDTSKTPQSQGKSALEMPKSQADPTTEKGA